MPDGSRSRDSRRTAAASRRRASGNVGLTAPHMHDGSLTTLEAVVEFYDQGGGPTPNLDPAIRPLRLSSGERSDLVAFLRALQGKTDAADNIE